MPMRLVLLVLLWLPVVAQAEDAEIAALFSDAGVTGTLLIQSANTGERHIHDASRAGQDFPVASTFKVLNQQFPLCTSARDGHLGRRR